MFRNGNFPQRSVAKCSEVVILARDCSFEQLIVRTPHNIVTIYISNLLHQQFH